MKKVFFIIFSYSMAQDTLPFKILYGHTEGINTIVYSNKHKLLISGSKDQTIKIWDVNNFIPVATYTIPGSSVKKLTLTKKNDYLVVSNYRNVYLFRFPDLKKTKSLKKIHDSYVESITLSPDEACLITSSWRGKSLRSFYFPSLKKKFFFPENTWIDFVLPISNYSFLSSGHDNQIKEWNLVSGQLTHIYNGHSDWIYDMDIDTSKKVFFSFGFDKTVIAWNYSEKKIIQKWNFFKNPLLHGCYVPEKEILFCSDTEGYIYAIDINKNSLSLTWKGHSSQISDLIYIKTENGIFLVSSSIDKTIKFWKL